MPIAEAVSSTRPGGSDTQIQINSSGAFGASPNLIFNADNDLVLSSGSIGIQGEFDGFAAGTGMAFDYASGVSKITCLGVDATTIGSFKIDIAESDAGSTSTPFEINNTQMCVANGGAYIVKGTLDGSMGTDTFVAMDYSVAGGRIITTGSATAIGTFTCVARSTDGDPATVEVFSIAANQNANFTGTVTTGSDTKLKTDVRDLDSVIATVKNLRPVKFKRVSQPAADDQTSADYYGFIAQEIQAHLPDLVHTSVDKGFAGEDLGTVTLSLAYTEIIPILTKAIQELETRIAALEASLT